MVLNSWSTESNIVFKFYEHVNLTFLLLYWERQFLPSLDDLKSPSDIQHIWQRLEYIKSSQNLIHTHIHTHTHTHKHTHTHTHTAQLEDSQKTWRDVSPKKTYRRQISTWKDDQYHLATRGMKIKPQWDTNTHLSK